MGGSGINRDSIQGKVFKSTIYNYAGSFANAVLSLLILLYLLKNLRVEEFGQYNLVLSTLVFFVLLLNLGIPSVILRYLPEYMVKGDFSNAKKIIKNGLFVALGAGLVLLPFFFLLNRYFSVFIDRFSLVQFLYIIWLLALLRVQVRILKAVFSSLIRKGFQNLFETLSIALKLGLIILSLNLGYGLIGVFISVGIADLFLAVAYAIRVFGYFKNIPERAAIISKGRFLKFGLKEYIGKLLFFFWESRIDVYFIIFYLGNYAAGIFYFVINIVTMLIQYLPGSIMQPVSRAIFARQYARHQSQKEISYLFKLDNKLTAFFTLPIFIGFILIADKIIDIFFVKYADSLQLFPVILFFMLFYIFLFPIRNIITTLEKSEISIISSAVILYKIPMTIFLTKNFGLIGTAYALGTSTLLYFLIGYFLTRRILDLRYPWGSFLKISINSFIMGLAIFLLKTFINSIFSLVAVVLIGGAIYFLAAYINKAFDAYDRQIINKPFKKIIWAF